MRERLNPLMNHITPLVLLIALALPAVCATPPQEETVRVGLVRFLSGIRSITVSSQSGWALRPSVGDQAAIVVPGGMAVTLTAAISGVSVERAGSAPIVLACPVVISPSEPSDTIKVEPKARPARSYRGSIEVGLKGGTLKLVNVVGLEDYVRGVLPQEMPSVYPAEALKAQAITARTYALANKGKHRSEGYDLCDTNMCQLYGGASAEKAKCSEAVDATRGIVLLHNGEAADVMYSTDCGGATQDYSESHPGKSIPYLCCVTEPEDISHAAWEVTTTLQELGLKLVKAGVKEAQGLTAISVSKTGVSGRVLELSVTGASGTATAPGYKLRSALGTETLKSTLYTLETFPDGKVNIKGRGWGHGQGLCQVGSKGLALPPHGYDYAQILAHYFPGTQLSSALDQPAPAQEIASAAPVTPVEPTPPAECVQRQKIEVTTVPRKDAPPSQQPAQEGVSLRVRLKDPGHL